jgi:hypothetical protein
MTSNNQEEPESGLGPDSERTLEAFIGEIRAIYEEESRENNMAHFQSSRFKPQTLIWEDKLIWDKVKNKIVTRDDIASYRESIVDPATRKLREDLPQSRYTFLAFIENKAAPVIGWREMEEGK